MAMWSHTSQARRERARRTAAHKTQTYQGCLPAVNAGSFIIIVMGAAVERGDKLGKYWTLLLGIAGRSLTAGALSVVQAPWSRGGGRVACRVCRGGRGRRLDWSAWLWVGRESDDA